MCRSKIPPERRPGKPHIQSIEEDENSDDDSPFVYTVNRNKRKDEKDWHVTIKVDHGHPTFKIDTGAQCNVMSIETYQQVTSQPLQKSHTRLITFSGHKIKSHGRARLLCEHKNRYTVAEFEIVKGCQNVLGLKTITDMKLVKRINALSTTETIIEEYADVFTGLGCVTNTLHHIKLDPAHTPVVHPPRRVPAAMRQKVKDELERMERLEVIERVHEPTDWVNSMVTATKSNGKLRICIDPRDLNKAIKREHYPMPTIEDVLTRIPKAKVFSVLDATSGYWQIQLDESSAKLCTFNTPFGRYMFKRLPFGVSSAQDVFQAIMTDIFGDIEGVEVVVDDLLIWAENDEQHDTILRKTLDRARQRNLKLNRDKSQIKQDKISYIGHVLSEEGLAPDPSKVEAIATMQTPGNKDDLQRFLSMATYLGKFIPNLSQIAAPLRALLSDNTDWNWGTEQEKSFATLKKIVTEAPVLKFFDQHKPVKISVDASSKGMGAVLLQDESPIAYASKSLTQCQQNYAQIEKELLAIVFGCTRFHDYIYGIPNVEVETDHKPLESILKKPLHQAPTDQGRS